MDSNVLIRGGVLPQHNTKRLRRCLNPGCFWVVGGGKLPLRKTRMGEYARLECPKCGAISVFNPVAVVWPHATKDIYVVWDNRRGMEHVVPKRRVLTP